MIVAPLPENEAERLRAVRQTKLLDTRPEEDFDTLVRLASVICGTPMALITLVDQDRQWFKANIGLEATETSRDIAFCAHTILQADLFVVEDALLDPRFAGNPLVLIDPLIRFYAGVPLRTGEGLCLGTLCVIDRSPRTLTRAQCDALHLLAEQVNKQISLRRQQHELEATISSNDLVEKELRASHALFHAFMDHAPFVGFLKSSDGKIVYYNQQLANRFGIDRLAWLGMTDEQLWPEEMASRIRAADLSVLREWKTLIIDEEANPLDAPPSLWRSYKFPFRDSEGREYVAGVAVDITADKLAEQKIRTYHQALESANEQLNMLAVTDGLTGLGNRRAFENALEHEYALAQRHGQPLSLLVLDIDDFKTLNDTFGHDLGDRLLRYVAEIMGNNFRTTDLCARYGGDEFVVILPNTTKESAAESAERLRATIAERDLDGHRIGISIGLATLDTADWTKSDFFRRADEALYNAKRNGKDRVAVFQ